MITKIAVCYDLTSKRRLWVAYPSLDDSELDGFERNTSIDQGLVYLPFELLEDANGRWIPGQRVDDALAELVGAAEAAPYNGPAPIPDNNTNPEL